MNGETEAHSFAPNRPKLVPEGPPSCQLLAQVIRSCILKWLKEQNLLNLIFLNPVDCGIVLA